MRYEYICDNCGDTFELDKSIEDRDKCTGTNCIKCTGGVIRRSLGNNGGFQLKGGGWADDGYSSHIGDTPKFKKTGTY